MFPFALFIVGSKLLHRGKRLAPACALLVLLCAAAHTPRATQRGERVNPAAAAARATGVPRLSPSNILDDLRRRAGQQPRPSARELAAYANDLLARRGFDYSFDACEVFKSIQPVERDERKQPAAVVYPYRLTREGGGGRSGLFHLVGEADGSMCGECYFRLPALRVTKREMLVVADGGRYRLRRPAGFVLDEAHLVDRTLRRVLRTWQMPYQTVPAGISPDGKLLYLDFREELGLGDLVLEVSEGGTLRFAVRRGVIEGEGEWLKDHPKDPKNAYLSFMRFRAGGGSHVVRFSGPCT